MTNQIDDATAFEILRTAHNMACAIRSGYAWTRSDDSPDRHAAILSDVENMIDRFSPALATIARGFVNGEREAFAAL